MYKKEVFMQCPKERKQPPILEKAELLGRLVRIKMSTSKGIQLGSFVINNQNLKCSSEYSIYTGNFGIYSLIPLISTL
jgi:hypothetical protein